MFVCAQFVSGAPGITDPARKRKGIHMTRSSYAAPSFDGTAALKERTRPNLVLIEGGRRDGADARPARPLSLRQSLLFVLLGVLLVGALCAASALVDDWSRASVAATIDDLPERELVARDGDSLWSIAESVDVPGVATSDVVSWISERNGLSDALLLSGQRLVVPGDAVTG